MACSTVNVTFTFMYLVLQEMTTEKGEAQRDEKPQSWLDAHDKPNVRVKIIAVMMKVLPKFLSSSSFCLTWKISEMFPILL